MDGIYCNHGFSGSVVEHKRKALLVAASFRATGVHQLASVLVVVSLSLFSEGSGIHIGESCGVPCSVSRVLCGVTITPAQHTSSHMGPTGVFGCPCTPRKPLSGDYKLLGYEYPDLTTRRE